MRRILIVYGTGHGQTRKISERIAQLLTDAGLAVTILDVGGSGPPPAPVDFDAVLIGASVRFGKHQRAIERYVREHVAALDAMPSAFFSVSGAAAGEAPGERSDARGYLQQFLDSTGWHPWLADIMAGAILYTKYNFLLRWLLRKVAEKKGGPADTSRDYEFTDWSQVEWFADAFREMIRIPSESSLEVPV